MRVCGRACGLARACTGSGVVRKNLMDFEWPELATFFPDKKVKMALEGRTSALYRVTWNQAKVSLFETETVRAVSFFGFGFRSWYLGILESSA